MKNKNFSGTQNRRCHITNTGIIKILHHRSAAWPTSTAMVQADWRVPNNNNATGARGAPKISCGHSSKATQVIMKRDDRPHLRVMLAQRYDMISSGQRWRSLEHIHIIKKTCVSYVLFAISPNIYFSCFCLHSRKMQRSSHRFSILELLYWLPLAGFASYFVCYRTHTRVQSINLKRIRKGKKNATAVC